MRARFAIPKVLLAALAAIVVGSGVKATAGPKDVCERNVVDRLSVGPLVETPARKGRTAEAFVILYSGDGGWAKADCEFSHRFAERGMPVLGVNSVRYFAQRRTPATAAADLGRWIDAYSARFGRPKVILMGYSFGASALPIIAEQLPPAERGKIEEVALAGPGAGAELVLRPRTWFNVLAADATPVAPALRHIHDLKVVCVYGQEDPHAACPNYPTGSVELRPVAAEHRFRGAYQTVVDAVVAPVPTATSG